MIVSDAQRRDRISELKAGIEGQVQLQRYYLTVKTQPKRTQDEIERIERSIKKMSEDRELLKHALNNASELYIEACERTEEMRKDIILLENQSKIEKLKELTSQLNGMGLSIADLVELNDVA